MKICPRCNAQNYDNAVQCFHCGLILPSSVSGYPVVVQPAQQTGKEKPSGVKIGSFQFSSEFLFWSAFILLVLFMLVSFSLRQEMSRGNYFSSKAKALENQNKTLVNQVAVLSAAATQRSAEITKLQEQKIFPSSTPNSIQLPEPQVSIQLPVQPVASQTTITLEGLYKVPEEVPYGTWEYRSSVEGKTCPVTTYSAMNSDWSNMVDYVSTDNKGYFTIDQQVKMVELEVQYGTTCVWTRIGD